MIANKVTDATGMRLMVIVLHAEAEAAYLQGQGIARQRQAIVNGLRESVLNFEDGVKAVSPQEVIELMMVSLSSMLAGYHSLLPQASLISLCRLLHAKPKHSP